MRKRSTLFKKREVLQARIDVLDEELETVDQEISVLEGFALTTPEAVADEPGRGEGESELLSGSEIRALAVPLLLKARGSAPIHYREWLELVHEKGFAVAGKRPDAVFLNQVVRSPLVHSTTKAGYYAADPAIVESLEATLLTRRGELAALMARKPPDPRQRESERELSNEIARLERELEEAQQAIHWLGLGKNRAREAA